MVRDLSDFPKIALIVPLVTAGQDDDSAIHVQHPSPTRKFDQRLLPVGMAADDERWSQLLKCMANQR